MVENNGIKSKNLAIAMATIELLKNGIVSDDEEVRDFDIIDYYQITKISPRTIFESTDKILQRFCSKDEYQAFYSFSLKHGDSPRVTIKEIMEMKHSIMVNDELKEITPEEKTIAIKYLGMNGIRLSADTYSAAIKREFAGTLNFEDEKEMDMNVKIKTLSR